jgi:hypothetical protein
MAGIVYSNALLYPPRVEPAQFRSQAVRRLLGKSPPQRRARAARETAFAVLILDGQPNRTRCAEQFKLR